MCITQGDIKHVYQLGFYFEGLNQKCQFVILLPKSKRAQPLSRPLSLCSITWECPPLNHHSYNEAWFKYPFFHFQYCGGHSPSGILSDSLPMWLGHPQCVMFWSRGHACFPLQHAGGVSNHILSTLTSACDSSLRLKSPKTVHFCSRWLVGTKLSSIPQNAFANLANISDM